MHGLGGTPGAFDGRGRAAIANAWSQPKRLVLRLSVGIFNGTLAKLRLYFPVFKSRETGEVACHFRNTARRRCGGDFLLDA